MGRSFFNSRFPWAKRGSQTPGCLFRHFSEPHRHARITFRWYTSMSAVLESQNSQAKRTTVPWKLINMWLSVHWLSMNSCILVHSVCKVLFQIWVLKQNHLRTTALVISGRFLNKIKNVPDYWSSVEDSHPACVMCETALHDLCQVNSVAETTLCIYKCMARVTLAAYGGFVIIWRQSLLLDFWKCALPCNYGLYL